MADYLKFPKSLQNFPKTLEAWVEKEAPEVTQKIINMIKGPSSFAESFEHITMLGCYFRSARLDIKSKAT